MSGAFRAKYDGLCHECKEPIHTGDLLVWVADAVAHADCEPEVTREHVERPTCPKCWTVTAANGSCGCEPE